MSDTAVSRREDAAAEAPSLARARARRTVPRLSLTPAQCAEALGISRDSFDRYVLPELRVVRRGRLVLVSVREVERWLDVSAARTLDMER
jgi:hypothetical protein